MSSDAMVVGLCQVMLRIPGARSLKDKRRVLRQILDRTRSRFPVSVAETGENDIHTRARVGFSFVTTDRRLAESTLDRAIEAIQALNTAQIVSVDREVMSWHGGWAHDGATTMAEAEALATGENP